ncbi:hypothetical protein TNCV_612571 [Trichonephila clavipes]|nr:hypothetical protein TNCV_612571 [Trichonephila clavipes]
MWGSRCSDNVGRRGWDSVGCPMMTADGEIGEMRSRMIRWVLKLAEFNIEWQHRPGTQNAMADVLSRNPVESIIGEKVTCVIIRDLVLEGGDLVVEGAIK